MDFKRPMIGTLLAASLLFMAAVTSAAAVELALSTEPGNLYPGQAVLVRVAASEPMEKVTADFKGQSIRLFPEPRGSAWSGLIGLDLDLAPGDHTVAYGIQFRDGSQAEGDYPITVEAKEYPEERIKVAKKYVNLSREDLDRVGREKR
ncbi:MAG: hypothetical protein R3231_02330 [bacterium]|nr:hypothetical protein [bacterium]